MITPGVCAGWACEEGRMDLGQVRYNDHDQRWERFDGREWAAIVAQPTAPGTVIVYESTDDDG